MDGPTEASARGKLAINTRLSRMTPAERKQMTVKAREAQRRKILAEVDPDGLLPPDEQERVIGYALKARMEKLRLGAKGPTQRAAERTRAANDAALDQLREAGDG